MHARGLHSPPTELVVIDGIKSSERGMTRDGTMRVYLSVEEALNLQRQIGVAVGEARGQQQLQLGDEYAEQRAAGLTEGMEP